MVITGASRGLGAGMALEMARLGVRLGLCARQRPEPPLAARETSFTASVDVREQDELARFAAAVADRLGPIDLWINNAGVLEPIAAVADLPFSRVMDHLATNVGGVVNGSRAYIRHLRAHRRGGVLINVSSGAAQSAYAGWGAYCASKAAVDRLTECIQLEEQRHGLRAHAVAPGVIDTDMQRLIRKSSRDVFPSVDKFVDRKRREAFNSPAFVAAQLLAIAFDPARRPERVVVRLPEENKE